MNFPIRNTFPTATQSRLTPSPAKWKQVITPQGNLAFVEDVSGSLNNIRGLGDIVAKIANPIKNAIINHGPEWAKEQLKHCGCEKRRKWLNEQFPITRPN